MKFSSDLSVWAPQYLSDWTWISPKASLSALVDEDMVLDVLKDRKAGVAAILVGLAREAPEVLTDGKPRRDAGLAQAERACGMRAALFVTVDRNMSDAEKGTTRGIGW